ncbi:hypothetical protein E0H53_33945 [Rhizobium leguminosarum bv. viciae]|uniref:hypothetical protein n=1 Tax=Rhizobium leguminosarum TaxID=384 RepID=UPI00103D23B6|nr:hypothetical protein [Rhizobium leguminosarum]TBZ78310.1 hypothetical protein E0H53_33945 [Rhizobium leguminosarum bv. viciae]
MRKKPADVDQILSVLMLNKEFDEKYRKRASRQLHRWRQEHVYEAEAESRRLRDALKETEEELKRTWTRIMMGQIGGEAACADLDRLITHIHSALEHSEQNAVPLGS